MQKNSLVGILLVVIALSGCATQGRRHSIRSEALRGPSSLNDSLPNGTFTSKKASRGGDVVEFVNGAGVFRGMPEISLVSDDQSAQLIVRGPARGAEGEILINTTLDKSLNSESKAKNKAARFDASANFKSPNMQATALGNGSCLDDFCHFDIKIDQGPRAFLISITTRRLDREIEISGVKSELHMGRGLTRFMQFYGVVAE